MRPLSPETRNLKTCPFCKELIHRSASRCRFCGAEVRIPKEVKKPLFAVSPFMLGFYTATCLWLILIILYVWYS